MVRSPQSVFMLIAGLCLVSWGCDRAPSAEGMPEWKPSEHHSFDDDKMGDPKQQGAPGGPAGSAGVKGDESTRLVEIAWQQNCVQCHGPTGHGDGQMGPMLHAPDLTQSKLADADMVTIIKGGKNKMPAYGQMPDTVVQGLVARIHRLRGEK